MERIRLLYRQFLKGSKFTISGKLDGGSEPLIYWAPPEQPCNLGTFDNIDIRVLSKVSEKSPYGDMAKLETVYDERIRRLPRC